MAVARALKMAKVECQYQMRHEPWDCPILDLDVKPSNMFGKLTTRSFRETSFIHSLLSAALAHSVTRACTDFMVTTCARGQSREGGHRENIEFGAMFAREFMEATHELSAWQPQHNNIIDTGSALAAGTGRNGSSSSLVGRSAAGSAVAGGNGFGAPPAPSSAASSAASRAPADYSPENSSRREKKLRFINAHNDEAGILVSSTLFALSISRQQPTAATSERESFSFGLFAEIESSLSLFSPRHLNLSASRPMNGALRHSWRLL